MCEVCGVLCVVLVTLQYQSVRDLQGGSSRGRIVREHVLELHVALLMCAELTPHPVHWDEETTLVLEHKAGGIVPQRELPLFLEVFHDFTNCLLGLQIRKSLTWIVL